MILFSLLIPDCVHPHLPLRSYVLYFPRVLTLSILSTFTFTFSLHELRCIQAFNITILLILI